MRQTRWAVIVAAAACAFAGGATLASAGSQSLTGKSPPPPKKGTRHAAPTKSLAPPLPKCTLRGTAGADFLRGTRKADVICGLGGPDHIWAGPNDIVVAGAGADTVYARNRRANLIVGGPGLDRARLDRDVDLRFTVERLLP
jgi:hemolysin type calcium-binding protein